MDTPLITRIIPLTEEMCILHLYLGMPLPGETWILHSYLRMPPGGTWTVEHLQKPGVVHQILDYSP